MSLDSRFARALTVDHNSYERIKGRIEKIISECKAQGKNKIELYANHRVRYWLRMMGLTVEEFNFTVGTEKRCIISWGDNREDVQL